MVAGIKSPKVKGIFKNAKSKNVDYMDFGDISPMAMSNVKFKIISVSC